MCVLPKSRCQLHNAVATLSALTCVLSMVNCVLCEFNLTKAILYESNNHNSKMVRRVTREASEG